MELISVIVPVYKVERFLDKCVSSLLAQTYKNMEIILVDDGSPDNSGAMCDEWEKRDKRIKVIHQENQGGGAARNAALDVAKGSLVTFVDSDDYIAKDTYEYLYGLIEEGADIAECSYVVTQDDMAIFGGQDEEVFIYTAQEAMKAHIEDRLFKQVIWNKIYKKEVISDIRFPIGTKIDDEFFTYQVLGNAKVLFHSEKVCYAYRQQSESVMHSIKGKRGLEAIEAKIQRCRYVEWKFPELKNDCLRDLWFSCIYRGQKAMRELDREEAQEMIKELETVFEKCPFDLCGLGRKDRIWLSVAKYSLVVTCWIRNKMHIGL